MAEFDELLAGIRAHPADELRRLVFADWLDENAHRNPTYGPWAAYIRWAIASERTPRTDPDYWKYRRYPQQPPDGLAKLLGVESQHFRFAWNGGFPDSVRLDPDTLQEHDRKLASLEGPIRRLCISQRLAPLVHQSSVMPIGYLPGGEASIPAMPVRWVTGPTLERVGELEVEASDLDAPRVLTALGIYAKALPPLILDLPGSDAVLTLLKQHSFPSLVGMTIRLLHAPQRLAGFPNLGTLTRFGLTNTSGPPGPFGVLPPELPNLTQLALSGTAGPVFLNSVGEGECPRLSQLEVASPVVNYPGWRTFAASPAFGRLNRLTLCSSDMDSIAPLWPEGLTEPASGGMTLNAIQLGPLRSVAVFESPLLHRCACLFVEGSEITADAYLALAGNPAARNLNVLSVQMRFRSAPFARGEPFAALCRSPHLAGLTELSLTFHDLTDEDFEELLSATFADGLRYLNLAGSYFSEHLLERLTDPDVLPALTWLDIHKPTNGSRRWEPALQKRFGQNFQL